MQNKIGVYSSILTFAAVFAFAVSMIVGTNYGSYISSLFISWGFVPMVCSLASLAGKDRRAAGYTAMAFSAIYAVFIALVYFAQLTTVQLSQLSEQASKLIDYSNFGLFFSYDLLGYAFMALATFFISFTIKPENKADKWLKMLLLIHGIFAVSCVIMPMLGIFKPGMAGGNLTGTLVLEFWCAYFIPVSLLALNYFRKKQMPAV